MKRFLSIIALLLIAAMNLSAQREKVWNQPYIDQRRFHFGFLLGMHSQDMLLTNNGVETDGEIWFAEIPGYSPGFTVGIIGDMYLNPYFNLRCTPTIHFGDKKFVFKRQDAEEGKDDRSSTTVRSNYLTFPLDVKYSAFRVNNYRPYITAGIYGALDLGRKKGEPLLLKEADFGIDFSLGCDIYLPFFKLSPELKFSFGLLNLLEKSRTDISDPQVLKYPSSLSKGTSRMVSLIFNFE